MSNQYAQYLNNLNHDNVDIRLENLRKLMELIKAGEMERPSTGDDVNNHIHTRYSFSPYSPTKAIWMAYQSGLKTAGIMDHDSVSGAEEFMEAGKIVGMATTIGVECRADFSKTPLNGKQINNPDQKSIAYMAIHGIPKKKISQVKDFFIPYVKERNKRNILMIEKINEILKSYEISLDFEEDVIPVSMFHEGGSITERHLLFALANKMIEKYGRGESLVSFLKDHLKLDLSSKVEKYLMDLNNPYYEYDLLGALKSSMVEQFYVDATKECPDVEEVIQLAREVGAISAYAYLGDVGDSVTGDKKAQSFEDDYLDLLFEVIHNLGFNAVTYMPSRNSIEQLQRVRALCEQYDFLQISGEDINSPRQAFICQALRNDMFHNLIDATWALIGHEKAANEDLNRAMFSEETIKEYPDLSQRIQHYKSLGKASISYMKE